MLIADYEKQYEEYRDAHPLTEKEKSSPRFLEAQRKAEELEARFRDPRSGITAVQGGYQDEQGKFILDPMVQEQMNIAIERAQAQLGQWNEKFPRKPMPGEAYDSARFPNRDPIGKYSVLEMELDERYKRACDIASVRPEEVGRYIGKSEGLERRLFNNRDAQLLRLEKLPEESQKYRLFTRAEKLCLDPIGRALLHQKALEVKNSPVMVECDRYMQGIEYMAGVKRGPIPEEVLQAYRAVGIELDLQMLEKSRRILPLEEMTVTFENYDNGIYHRFAAMPENWGLTQEEIEEKFDRALKQGTLKPEFLEGSISPYAKATVDTYLEPYYIDTESRNENYLIDRSTLVIIDGKTVRERMIEDYMAQNQGTDRNIGAFENDYAADPAFRYKANEYVAAALMAGRRVEAFVPDASGRLPEQPMRIVKDGYTPTPLKKVTLSLWERFASKFGFYKEKVAEAKEYKRAVEEKAAEEARMSEARDRVKASYFCERSVDMNLSGEDNKELFFGDYMRTHGGALPNGTAFGFDTNRSAYQTLAVCFLMKEQNDRYSLEDIFDPGKLHAEKLAAGNAVAAMLEAGDKRSIAELLLAGQDRVVKFLEEKSASGFDFLDMQQLMKSENQVIISAIKCGYDAVQEAQHRELREDYKAAFDRYAAERGLVGRTEEEMLFNPLSSTSLYVDNMTRGLKAGVELSSGLANEAGATGVTADFSNIVTMQAVRQSFRDAQAENPGVPFCRLIKHDDLVASGVVSFGAAMELHGDMAVADKYIGLKLTVEKDGALQKEIGRSVLNGRIDECIEVGIKDGFSCKLRESSKAAERVRRIEAQEAEAEKAGQKKTKEKAAPERGRSR